MAFLKRVLIKYITLQQGRQKFNLENTYNGEQQQSLTYKRVPSQNPHTAGTRRLPSVQLHISRLRK